MKGAEKFRYKAALYLIM